MDDNRNETGWYVTRVHNMSFNNTRKQLDNLGTEYFVAEYQDIVVRNGKKIKTVVPALRDIIFIHASLSHIDSLISKERLPLIYYYSHCSHKQNDVLRVRDKEMDNFMRGLRAYDRNPLIQPFGEIELREGDLVRVVSGEHAGIEGYYTQPKRGQRKHLVLTLGNLLLLTLRLSPTDLLEHLPSPGK